MKTSPAQQVVCDAGPLIHLDELGCLDLLNDLIVLVPDVVWKEVAQHRPAFSARANSRWTRVASPLPLDEADFAALVRAFALDAGEQSALA